MGLGEEVKGDGSVCGVWVMCCGFCLYDGRRRVFGVGVGHWITRVWFSF